MRKLWSVGTALAFVVAGSAGAQSLTNAGFETGDMTGWTAWTVSTDSFCTTPTDASVTNVAAHTGTYSLAINRLTGCDGFAFQPYAFVVGHNYQVDYWSMFMGDPTDPNTYETIVAPGTLTDFGGGSTPGGSDPGVWTFHTTVMGIFDPSYNAFWIGGRNPSGPVLLDDIAVTDITTTPEPASLALLGTGLFALVPFARRRIRSSRSVNC